jgi:hypothetical protein
MAALSTSSYGKAPAMKMADFADRLTAALQNAQAMTGDLDADAAAGAPVNAASVNTLRKMMSDLTELATEARQAAADEGAAVSENDRAGGDTGKDAKDGTGVSKS